MTPPRGRLRLTTQMGHRPERAWVSYVCHGVNCFVALDRIVSELLPFPTYLTVLAADGEVVQSDPSCFRMFLLVHAKHVGLEQREPR